jgi:hypothetical protein
LHALGSLTNGKKEGFSIEFRRPSDSKTNSIVMRLSNNNESTDNAIPSSKKTQYSTALSKAQISSFALHLQDEILDRHKLDPSRKFILYLRDLTDIMNVPGQCGRQLILALTHVITELRIARKVPIILVAGSSPALTDEANLEKDYYFYMQFFDNSKTVVSNPSNEHIDAINLISDGTIFNTCVDRLPQFEKVSVFPPSSVFNLLSRLPGKSKDKGDYLKFLDQMSLDLKTRLRQINCSNMLTLLKLENVQTTGLETVSLPEVKLHLLGMPEDYETLVAFLETGVWTESKVKRLVLYAIDAAKSRLTDSMSSVTVSQLDFIEALAKVYEADVARLSTLDHQELSRAVPAVDGDDNAGGAGLATSSGAAADKIESATKNGTIIVEKEMTHEESIGHQLKKKVKLNQYEKKLLSTIVNPSTLVLSRYDESFNVRLGNTSENKANTTNFGDAANFAPRAFQGRNFRALFD